MNTIVWAEGIFLSQQHFQTWDRQLRYSQHVRQTLLSPFSWGVISLSVDQEALDLGRFQVIETAVLFKNGQLVNYQASADGPLSCDLQAPGGDALSIYLAVPANNYVDKITGYPQRNQLSGLVADYQEVEDTFDANRKREILLAKPNLYLLTDSEALNSFFSIKIAEVMHDGDKRYRLINSFIPPICKITASPVLNQRLGRIVDTLNAKRKLIEQAREGCDGGAPGFARKDPHNHALLQNLNTIIPHLKHLLQSGDLHPERLYGLLCHVAGCFCTYHATATIDNIPIYDHEDLTQVFKKLDTMLSVLLELNTTARSTDIVLENETPNVLSCLDISPSILKKETFFLEVLFDGEDPTWITDFARQIKVTARNHIETSVASAMPGVRLIHTQRPPAKLATRSGAEYFRLDARGDVWNQMIKEGSIAIYLPQSFISSVIKLITVEE